MIRSLMLLALVLILVLVAAGFASVRSAVAEEPADSTQGFVLAAGGDGWIHRVDERAPMAVGSRLLPGDTLVVRMGASCRGFFPNGEEFQLVGPAEVVLDPAVTEDPLSRMTAWLRAQITRWCGETRRVPLTTRSAPRWEVEAAVPALLVPSVGGKVRPDRVAFRWSAVPGVDTYLLTLLSEEAEEVERTVTGTAAVFERLQPGAEYAWRIRPLTPELEFTSSWGSFQVLGEEDAARIHEAIREADPLKAGVLLLVLGLDGEAVERLDEAVKQEGEACPPRYWRARALARIGLHDEAVADLFHCGMGDAIRID